MPTLLPASELIAELETVWRSIDELASGFSDADWARPTNLPGWTVKDNLSHIVGTESMLLGRKPPEVDLSGLEHLRNDIARFNEAWVHERRPRPGPEVLAEFREVTAERLAALRAMTQEQFDEESFTPAGKDTYGRFMRIRVYDCWMHEQDMRDAVDRPGHASGPVVRRGLDEVGTAVGFIVGKRAGAPEGSRVRIVVTGPEARTWNVEVTDRARVVDELSGEPTVELTTDTGTFMRLTGGRIDPEEALAAGRVRLGGPDTATAERLARNLAFTI